MKLSATFLLLTLLVVDIVLVVSIKVFRLHDTMFYDLVIPQPSVTQAIEQPSTQSTSDAAVPEITPSPVAETGDATQPSLRAPIDEFSARITKKPFGIYITSATSPVQPERFSGYHTGVDVEYEDRADDVPVYAIADGTVLRASRASGYGGILVMRHTIAGSPRAVIYGHLDPGRLPAVGSRVVSGETIGYLGKGGTNETDGERRHLHFAIRSTDNVNLRGYVARKGELGGWLDPAEIMLGQ